MSNTFKFVFASLAVLFSLAGFAGVAQAQTGLFRSVDAQGVTTNDPGIAQGWLMNGDSVIIQQAPALQRSQLPPRPLDGNRQFSGYGAPANLDQFYGSNGQFQQNSGCNRAPGDYRGSDGLCHSANQQIGGVTPLPRVNNRGGVPNCLIHATGQRVFARSEAECDYFGQGGGRQVVQQGYGQDGLGNSVGRVLDVGADVIDGCTNGALAGAACGYVAGRVSGAHGGGWKGALIGLAIGGARANSGR